MSYNPYRKYCVRWWKYWLNLPGDVYDFFVTMYDYAPLLWNDRDWDYAYLLKMMRFKIRRMAKRIHENHIIAHAEDVHIELLMADLMLRNIEEDPDDEWSQHWSQWHTSTDWRDDHKCGNEPECKQALEASHKRSEDNWHKLWAHLDKHAQGWWD